MDLLPFGALTELPPAGCSRNTLGACAAGMGNKRMAVMRAMHKTVRHVYSASPWMAENTMRAVYAIGHHQPYP